MSGARVASDAFDLSGGGKRQKTGLGGAIQATDAVEELHRRSAMAALTAGRFGAAGDEFGDDPLDEERWNQRDEERKATEAKERAAQLALQQAKTLAAQQLEAEQTRQQQAAIIAAAPPPAATFIMGARPPPSRPPPPGYICHSQSMREQAHSLLRSCWVCALSASSSLTNVSAALSSLSLTCVLRLQAAWPCECCRDRVHLQSVSA